MFSDTVNVMDKIVAQLDSIFNMVLEVQVRINVYATALSVSCRRYWVIEDFNWKLWIKLVRWHLLPININSVLAGFNLSLLNIQSWTEVRHSRRLLILLEWLDVYIERGKNLGVIRIKVMWKILKLCYDLT